MTMLTFACVQLIRRLVGIVSEKCLFRRAVAAIATLFADDLVQFAALHPSLFLLASYY